MSGSKSKGVRRLLAEAAELAQSGDESYLAAPLEVRLLVTA